MLVDAEKGIFYLPCSRLADGAILISTGGGIKRKDIPQLLLNDNDGMTVYKPLLSTKDKLKGFDEMIEEVVKEQEHE